MPKAPNPPTRSAPSRGGVTRHHGQSQGQGVGSSALPFDLFSLIPESYAAYGPLLTQALALFLAHLPAGRRGTILAEQAHLPRDTPPAQRLTALARHCPTLHKLAQVLARDRRLDPGSAAGSRRWNHCPRPPWARPSGNGSTLSCPSSGTPGHR